MATLQNPYRDITDAADRKIVQVFAPKPDSGRPYRAMPSYGQYRQKKPVAPVKARRGRRTLQPYTMENPLEARAIPYEIHPQSILERIQYKRNLYLFGEPSSITWEAQYPGVPSPDLLKLDFVYWLVDPPVCIEPQGMIWHDAFAEYGDASRQFYIESYGFRYFEIFEDDILVNTDSWFDDQILLALGSTNTRYDESTYTYNVDRKKYVSGGLYKQVFKEARFR